MSNIPLPLAFLHLDPALSYPDSAWRDTMRGLPAPLPEDLPRRVVSRHVKPWLLVVAGPNGAGKTTLYRTRLARLWPGVPFVNADMLSGASLGHHALTEEDARLGQRMVAAQLEGFILEKEDFVWETVFSHPSRLDRILAWKEAGYQVGIVGVHPGSADRSVERVARRVQEGGHPVPEDRIRGRFARAPGLITEACKIADAAWWLDSSEDNSPPRVVARWRSGVCLTDQDHLPVFMSDIS